MPSTSEIASVPLTLTNSVGTSVSVMLTPDAAEALGLQLVAQAGANRPLDPQLIQEQQKMLSVNEPETALVIGADLVGRESIALVFKPDGMRPTWIWYTKAKAVELAHAILTLSAEKPKRSN